MHRRLLEMDLEALNTIEPKRFEQENTSVLRCQVGTVLEADNAANIQRENMRCFPNLLMRLCPVRRAVHIIVAGEVYALVGNSQRGLAKLFGLLVSIWQKTGSSRHI